MIVVQSAESLQMAFNSVWFTIVSYVPTILAAAAILVIGWIIGIILGKVVEQIVEMLRVDDALKAAGVNDAAKDAGFPFDAGKLVGGLVKWFTIIVFLVTAFEILGLMSVTIFLQQVVISFLPQVFIAVLIIIIAAVVADVVQKIVVGSARAAGVEQASLAGAFAKWAIWIFAVFAALTQLGIAAPFWQTLFTGFVVAFSLAFGLAFGLGGKAAAEKAIERLGKEMDGK